MVVVDRMKIGFMVEDELPLPNDTNPTINEPIMSSLSSSSNNSKNASPMSSPKTIDNISTATTASALLPPPMNSSGSSKYEEEDEDGVMILSTFATSPTPSPAVKPIKIPSISSLTTTLNSATGSSSNNLQSYQSYNPNISYQNSKGNISDQYQLSPRKQQYNAGHPTSSPSQMHANGLAIPNFSSFLSARQQMELSHGSSPKLDSVRTTPTGSVSSSPFITPRETLGMISSPPSSGMLQPLAGIAEDHSYSIGGGGGSPPRSPCSDDDLVICGENPDGSLAFGPRSMACDKHSKWKKRCPDTCVGRVSPVEFPTTTRKLWSQDECCRLLEMVFQKDPQSVTSKESEQRWRYIANSLGRTVTSTRKKYMRLMNKWSPRPSMTTSVHPISKLIESNERKRKQGFDQQQQQLQQSSYKDQKIVHDPSQPPSHPHPQPPQLQYNSSLIMQQQHHPSSQSSSYYNNSNTSSNNNHSPLASFTSYHGSPRDSNNNHHPPSSPHSQHHQQQQPYFNSTNSFTPIQSPNNSSSNGNSNNYNNHHNHHHSQQIISPKGLNVPQSPLIPPQSPNHNHHHNNYYLTPKPTSPSSSSIPPNSLQSLQGGNSPHHHHQHHHSHHFTATDNGERTPSNFVDSIHHQQQQSSFISRQPGQSIQPKQHPIPIQPLTPNIKLQQPPHPQQQQHSPSHHQYQPPLSPTQQPPLSPTHGGGGGSSSLSSFQSSQSTKFKKPIGRPAESCIQHRTEHQKCPKDCPYRPDVSLTPNYQLPLSQSPPPFKTAGLMNI